MKGSREAITILRGFIAGNDILISAVRFNDKLAELSFHRGSETGRRVVVKNSCKSEQLRIGVEYTAYVLKNDYSQSLRTWASTPESNLDAGLLRDILLQALTSRTL